MGIRIHKMLGWGLDDVHFADYNILDTRINSDSPLLEYEGPTFREYRAWLRKTNAERDYREKNMLDSWYLQDLRRIKRKHRHDTVSDSVVWRDEYGLGNVLCVRPISCTDWARYDDSIDYIVEVQTREHIGQNHAEILMSGIYPFTTYMDKRTGIRTLKSLWTWLIMRSNANEIPRAELDMYAQSGGYADHADALENVVPNVPTEVRDICQFGELFTSDDVWKQMRPMIYTYWG